MHLADAFIQSNLHFKSGYTFFTITISGYKTFFCQYVCVPWELNPQTFALLTQCSSTEPQEHTWVYVRMDLQTTYMKIPHHMTLH